VDKQRAAKHWPPNAQALPQHQPTHQQEQQDPLRSPGAVTHPLPERQASNPLLKTQLLRTG